MSAGSLAASFMLLAQETGQGAAGGPENASSSSPILWILIAAGALAVMVGLVALLRRLR